MTSMAQESRTEAAVNPGQVIPDRKDNLESKYLTFSLGNEEYGIDIIKIREIIGLMKVTALPRMPAYVKGVINLRGRVIPIVDLRLRFGMEAADYTERTCIIVVEIGTNGGRKLVMGIVVDSVSEVLNIRAGEVEDAPAFGAALETGFIQGMAKSNGGVKILLDIDRILCPEETEMLAAAGDAEIGDAAAGGEGMNW